MAAGLAPSPGLCPAAAGAGRSERHSAAREGDCSSDVEMAAVVEQVEHQRLAIFLLGGVTLRRDTVG